MSTLTDLTTIRRAPASRSKNLVRSIRTQENEPFRTRSLTLPGLLLVGDVSALTTAAVTLRSSVLLAVLFVATFVVVAASNALYRPRLSLSLLDDLPKLLTGWLAASAVILTAGNFVDGSTGLVLAAAAVPALVLSRIGCYALARHLRSTGVVAHRTLILGTSETGQNVAQVLREHPVYGLRPLGFLGSRTELEAATTRPLPVLGDPSDLARVVQDQQVGVVVLAYEHSDVDLVPLIRSCHRLQCELFLIPRFSELHSISDNTEMIWGVPMVRLRRAAHRTFSWRFKRILDVAVASTALVLLAPLLAVISLAVRREGGPGIIFRQTRVGIDGRTFDLLKFRSMRPADETESETNWSIAQDDRVGPVGRFLRRSSLDELPQLVNIVRGDMAIVGPRPERPYFVEQFRSLYPSYGSRDRVPSGLTGWAQVHGLRGETSVDERAEFDNFYIENWSLWLDVKIMMKTVSSVFSSPGA